MESKKLIRIIIISVALIILVITNPGNFHPYENYNSGSVTNLIICTILVEYNTNDCYMFALGNIFKLPSLPTTTVPASKRLRGLTTTSENHSGY